MPDVSYVGAGAAASATGGADPTPGYPAGLQAGDLILLVCSTSVATHFGTGAVSGFTRRVTNTSGGSSPFQAIFYRWATGSESGTVTVTNPGGSSQSRMFAYRSVDPTTPFDVADALFGISTATLNYVIPAQTPTLAGALGFTYAVANATAGSFTPPTDYTEIWDSNAAGTASTQEVSHRLTLAAADTGTRTVVRSGSVRGCAIGVILRPAPAVVPFVGWGVPM